MERINRIQGGEIHLVAVGGGRAYPRYSGPTEITPSQQEQTLYTSGCRLANDITINPIPSNYGRITWNGTALTIT